MKIITCTFLHHRSKTTVEEERHENGNISILLLFPIFIIHVFHI